MNGTSLLTKLSVASNAKVYFFNVCSNYSETMFYGDGMHDHQPITRAAISAAEAALVATECCVAHVHIFQLVSKYLGSSVPIGKALKFEYN